MTDLFAAAECHKAERAGILEFEAGIPRATAEAMAERSSEEFRHRLEVLDVLAKTKAGTAAEYLKLVAEKRGKEAADRLEAEANALEVSEIVTLYQLKGKEAVTFRLAEVEDRRGFEVMEKLRTAAIAEVKRTRTEQNQNA